MADKARDKQSKAANMLERMNQKRSQDFFRNIMAYRKRYETKYRKITIKMAYGMIIRYHLYMPSYF